MTTENNTDIDDYSRAKFEAAKDYIENFGKDKKFAFVRPESSRLVYSNTDYDKDKDLRDHDIWRAIEDLFE